MILLSHPTGNTFARAMLTGLEQAQLLDSFHTTIAINQSDWLVRMAPPRMRSELLRRHYSLASAQIITHPLRELVRLVAPRCGFDFLTAHEHGWASMDKVSDSLDAAVAKYLEQRFSLGNDIHNQRLSAVYCYEDCALRTFEAARAIGAKCIYDLPIAYWKTVQALLTEEAERLPEWEPTLVGTRDSQTKLERKTAELELAELVVCPSKFVFDSLPDGVKNSGKAIVAEFGSPTIERSAPRTATATDAKLRVLFAGAMSQRKGLADVFTAMKILNRADIELVVMGSPIAPMEFYRKHFERFIYEPPRTHDSVLELMRSCHILVLPSIVEGRALVQQEAMISGLPLVTTANAGGEDLIEEGKTGFLVPIRKPDQIAERLSWFAGNRERLQEMSALAKQKAADTSWVNYQGKVLSAINLIVEQQEAR